MRLLRCSVIALAAVAVVLSASGAAQAARAPGQIDGAYIVVLESSAGSTDSTTDRLQRRRGFRARLRFRRALRGFSARLSDEQAARLREEPEVASVTPDRPVKALGEVALTGGDSVPTGIRRIAAGTPTRTREASSASVAVLDSGIDLTHPDLNAANGTNCIRPGTPAQDDDGHGTHVAGTISAKNDGRGVVGVAPGTRTHAVKVLNAEGEGTSSQIICGVDWVTATRTDADPTNDIAVANLSLGGTGAPVAPCETTRDPLHRAICASTRAGVTYVAAAGNDAWDFDDPRTPDFPASYPEVLTVSAVADSDGAPGAQGGAPGCRLSEADDARATFSNYAATSAGAAHTVAAPGVCIRSTWLGGGYNTISGTSMASPHVAGAIALCLGEAGTPGPCAGLSAAGVVAQMRDTAASQGAAFGFGGDPTRPITGRYFGYMAWAGVPGATAPVVPPANSPVVPPANEPVTPPVSAPDAAPVTPPVGSAPEPPSPPAASPAPAAASRPLADKTAPTTAIALRRQRLKTVLRRGLAAGLRCSEACVATAEVWLSGATSKRLGLTRGARARIARRSSIRFTGGTGKTVTLKLSRAARRRLARARRVTMTLRLTVTDPAGNPRQTARRITVSR